MINSVDLGSIVLSTALRRSGNLLPTIKIWTFGKLIRPDEAQIESEFGFWLRSHECPFPGSGQLTVRIRISSSPFIVQCSWNLIVPWNLLQSFIIPSYTFTIRQSSEGSHSGLTHQKVLIISPHTKNTVHLI